jgi:hypothetical protein
MLSHVVLARLDSCQCVLENGMQELEGDFADPRHSLVATCSRRQGAAFTPLLVGQPKSI